jgi:Na+/citrate or Na+/malate symporter
MGGKRTLTWVGNKKFSGRDSEAMADQQQSKIDQRNTGVLMMGTLAAQAALSFAQLPSGVLLLPPAALAVVIVVLTLRSESMLRSLRRKRAFLAKTVFAIAACVTLVLLLVDQPRNGVLFWAAALVLIDFGFLALGRLVGSVIGRDSAAPA